MNPFDIFLASVLAGAIGFLIGRASRPRNDAPKAEATHTLSSYQRDSMDPDAAPPKGYGALIVPEWQGRPHRLDGEEIVARHLPCGLSERKAQDITTWDHPYRLREDHPHYAQE